MSFTVAKDGTTRNHGIVAVSDLGFIDASVAAVKKLKYEPPIVAGHPAEVHRRRAMYG